MLDMDRNACGLYDMVTGCRRIICRASCTMIGGGIAATSILSIAAVFISVVGFLDLTFHLLIG